jgi:hypothetical protein
MTYHKGQRVRRPVYNWYFEGNNPVQPGELGIVKCVFELATYKYQVVWDGGHKNSYRDEDLEPFDTRSLEEQVEELLG